MEYYSLTDKGKVRSSNQDSISCSYNQDGDFLAVLADGIGGHKSGDIAAFEITSYLAKVFSEIERFKDKGEVLEFINYYVHKVNKDIYQMSLSQENLRGMGSTLVALLITRFGNFWINVGDSRIYALKDKKLIQLSSDHTLINELLNSKLITKQEARLHPKRHHITKAIGVWENVDIDYQEINSSYQYYLLCSDGLHGFVDDQEIEKILNDDRFDTMNKAKRLLKISLDVGGYDNISIILIKSDRGNL